MEQFIAINSSDDKRDDIKSLTNTLCIGIVVDTDDPLEQGRLRVWCPDLNDSPKKVLHIPWASYVTPYGGSINNSCYTRGHIAGQETSSGSMHYGFWGIPEHGAHVIVACINGDSRRRVWLGCLPEQQETHTLFTGRFKWEGGNVDGPLTSSNSPLEPAYTNASEAFQDDRESAEWKTRGAEYQAAAVREDLSEIPSPSKATYLDNQYPQISEAEQDDWVKPKVGSHGYDWTGHKQLGEFKSSRVYGMSTPGLHAFYMDDRAFNSRIRLKSTAGHQILLDDTNERVYISTFEGKSYIEMDVSGNIDIFADRRISVHGKKDINIESDETVRIKGKKGIHMYAGDTTGQSPLESVPADGQIRFHSTDDMHMFSEKNLRLLVNDDVLFEIGNNWYNSVGGIQFNQIEGGINTIVNDGDVNTSITGNTNTNVSNNISQIAGNDTQIHSVNNSEVFSFGGKMDIGAEMNINISSKSENIGLEAEKKAVTIDAGESKSSATFNEKGIIVHSEEKVMTLAKTDIEVCVSDDLTTEYLKDGDNNPLDGSCINIPGVKIRYDAEEITEETPKDHKFKIPGKVEESVEYVNKKFEELEEKWDEHMLNMDGFMGGIEDAITNVDPSNLVIPRIPNLPIPLPPYSLQLPSLNLPNLTFPDVCINLDNLIDVEPFNLLPEKMFQLNIDMGGWTTDNIRGWVDNFKNDFDNFKNSISVANIASQLQNEISELGSALNSTLANVANLVDINITDKNGEITLYSANLVTVLERIGEYDLAADIANLPTLPSKLTSKLSGHIANIANRIESFVNFDGFDYSGLRDVASDLEGMLDDIFGGI